MISINITVMSLLASSVVYPFSSSGPSMKLPGLPALFFRISANEIRKFGLSEVSKRGIMIEKDKLISENINESR